MGCLGNFLWFIFGGAVSGLSWCLAGCLWCITIVGIPVGTQCFKLAALSFFPFGKEVRYGGGAGSFLLNILWLIFSGLALALVKDFAEMHGGTASAGETEGRTEFRVVLPTEKVGDDLQ